MRLLGCSGSYRLFSAERKPSIGSQQTPNLSPLISEDLDLLAQIFYEAHIRRWCSDITADCRYSYQQLKYCSSNKDCPCRHVYNHFMRSPAPDFPISVNSYRPLNQPVLGRGNSVIMFDIAKLRAKHPAEICRDDTKSSC